MGSCRACLRQERQDQLRAIFEFDASDLWSTAHLYCLLTSIEIKPTSDCPEYFCCDCEKKLVDFQHFRETCIASDQHIRAHIPNELSITKSEPLSPTRGDLDVDDVHEDDDNNACSQSDAIRCDVILGQFDGDDSGDDTPPLTASDEYVQPGPASSVVSRIRSPAASAAEPNHSTSVKKLQCDMCGSTFTTKHRIKAHLRTHAGLKPHGCDDCPAAFGNYVTLRNHRLSEHGDASHPHAGRRFACEIAGCTKSYGEQYKLRKHVDRIHTKAPGQLICETCGKTFHTRQTLNDHLYLHRDPSTYPYACDMCPKRYISKFSFETHKKRHRNIRNFQCTECPQRTYTRAELSVHMEYHNKELNVQCTKCPNKFTTKMGLRRHMTRVHSGRKPYVCSHCGVGFAKKETMVNHEMRHTGEKPHACPICDQRFRQVVTMKTHMKVHAK